MEAHDNRENPEPGSLEALYDRLERLLRRLPPERIEKLIHELESYDDGQESKETQAERN